LVDNFSFLFYILPLIISCYPFDLAINSIIMIMVKSTEIQNSREVKDLLLAHFTHFHFTITALTMKAIIKEYKE